MKQSIIITFHKDKNMLFYCLKRLLDTISADIEIIIVGNNINHEGVSQSLCKPPN